MNTEVPSKDNEKAENARQKGNKHFGNGCFEDALCCYNQALVLSEPGSQCMATALANRSAVAQQHKQWQACLHDIELALELAAGQPELQQLDKKWQQRRATALRELKKSRQPQQNAPQPLHNGQHKHVAGMSNAVRVVCDAAKGRKLVAAERIPAGALIIRDTPIAHEILPDFAERVCHACCQPLGIHWLPCQACARHNVRFCSSACRDSAWDAFHALECGMPFGFHSSVMRGTQPGEPAFKNSNSRLIAQRTITSQQPSQIVAADPERQEAAAEVAVLGTEQDQVYDNSLRSVMSLMSRQDAELVISEQTFTFSSTSTDMFINQSGWPKGVKVAERRRLCLRLLNALCERIRVNSWGIKVLFADGSIDDIGSGLYPTGSLLNHSCLPNVCESFDGRTAEWRARSDIEPGTEICTTYCPHFGVQRRQERLEHLYKGYGFRCDCAACNTDEYERMEQQLFGFSCAACKLPAEEEVWSEEGELECAKCGLLPYTASQIRDAADAIRQETARRTSERDCDTKQLMQAGGTCHMVVFQLLKKLEPMLGKGSELQFQLRATIGKSLCGHNDQMAVAMIEQLLSQRQQYYGQTPVMAWLNGIAMSVHFMVDQRSARSRQLMRDEVQRLIGKTGVGNTRILLNGVPEPMGPHLIACYEKIIEQMPA